MVWKGPDSRGRLARSLVALIDQVDRDHPGRSKVSDGSIGDRAHAARVSDHNPGADSVVEAIDITHDPAHGVDTWKMAEILRINKDPRVDYVISNGRVFVGNHGRWNGRPVTPWTWLTYTGQNKHAQHIHVSVDSKPSVYDQAHEWKLKLGDDAPKTEPAPTPPKPPGITDAMRRRMMQTILEYEGRFQDGELRIYIASDGQPEIAGITRVAHPAVYEELRAMLARGNQAALKTAVLDYYDNYTDQAQNWTDQAGNEFMLRDCILHRGPTGAAEILQTALGVTVDRQVGPTTRGALAALHPNTAIDKIRAAREQHEERKYGKAYRVQKKQWDGLVNRWNKAQADAKRFQQEQHGAVIAQPVELPPPPDVRGTTPARPSLWDRFKGWLGI